MCENAKCTLYATAMYNVAFTALHCTAVATNTASQCQLGGHDYNTLTDQ